MSSSTGSRSPFLFRTASLFLALALLPGCVTENKQVAFKTTTLGLVITTSAAPGLGGLLPNLKLGLIRDFYVSNPTSTNRVYAAPFESDVDATLGILSQKANEKFNTLSHGLNTD